MKNAFPPFLFFAALLSCPGAHAQSIEAQRYMGSQGIEMIQNRSAPAKSQAVVAAPASEARAASNNGPRSPVGQAGNDSRMQVAPATQAARDRDRLAILQQELVSEASVYQSKSHILQNPARLAKMAADEIFRLKAALIDHEKNIRTLNTEIGRMKPPR